MAASDFSCNLFSILTSGFEQCEELTLHELGIVASRRILFISTLSRSWLIDESSGLAVSGEDLASSLLSLAASDIVLGYEFTNYLSKSAIA